MNPRARNTTLVVVLALGMLALGLYLGGHPGNLPGFARDWFVSEHASVESELIDQIEANYYKKVSPDQLDQASLKGIVASLGDRFSEYFTPAEARQFAENLSGRFGGVGMAVDSKRTKDGLHVSRVFPGSPAAQAGIATGARIVGVDGRSIIGVDPDVATARIRGPAGTKVTLTFIPPGGKSRRTATLTRKQLRIPLVSGRIVKSGGKKLGYVQLAAFDEGAGAQLDPKVRSELQAGARGIILDLRGNGGGEVTEAQRVASIFLPKGRLVVTTRGRTVPEQKLYASGGAIPPTIPMVVLVDSGTASASEIVTGALRDWNRATIVGTRTFGKGVFQEAEPLSNDGLLKLTVGSYYLPKGENLQGHGILPPVKASDSPKTPHRDEALPVAIRTLAAKVR